VHYQDPKFAGVRVVTTALDIADIAPDCDLFIGAGGTMTREMAVLGIPTISVYQDACSTSTATCWRRAPSSTGRT
jgi:predicted glycosyltransferase